VQGCALWASEVLPQIRIIGVKGLPEIEPGDDLTTLIIAAAEEQGTPIDDDDVIVVTQKIVSKAEGRLVALGTVQPSSQAQQIASETGKDPRLVQVILGESQRIVRQTSGVLITQTRQGFVCANAGIDASNIGGQDHVSLLPEDPDASAATICKGIEERLGKRVAVVISDTFGRPWRLGHTNVAVGVAGMLAFVDYVGETDPQGYELKVSIMAVTDELAGAAELVMGKLSRIPVAIVRGFPYPKGEGKAQDLVRPPEQDLFR